MQDLNSGASRHTHYSGVPPPCQQKSHSAKSGFYRVSEVELSGFEPLTCSMRTNRSTN